MPAMETRLELRKSAKPLNILLVGNNPIELTRILEKLNHFHGRKLVTEIAFDLRSLADRLLKFQPNLILIDDNIGRQEMTETIQALASNKKTRDVPVTVLKNSNYEESTPHGILDYALKQNFSAESLHTTLRNSLKFRRTQLDLHRAYRERKRELRKTRTRSGQPVQR